MKEAWTLKVILAINLNCNDLKPASSKYYNLYVASFIECFRASEVPIFPSSCNSFCRDCFRNTGVCDNHTDLYNNNLNCDVRPCETCERSLKESKNLVCKEFCNLSSVSDQEIYEANFSPFQSFLADESVLDFEFCHMTLDINRKWASNP